MSEATSDQPAGGATTPQAVGPEEICDYIPPPPGWVDFGSHAPLDEIPLLTFSDEQAEDGLPRWEKHTDGTECTCDLEFK